MTGGDVPVADAKSEILARIRGALGTPTAPPEVPRGYRLAGEHPPGSAALLALLADRLVDYRAQVRRCAEDAVAARLAEIVAAIVPAGGQVLVPPGLPESWTPAHAVTDDGLDPTALDQIAVTVTGCAGAAAETGTIALDAGPGQGRRALTLVPDRHICLVRADQVVQTVPELLARLDPARPLTLISGPSATSDIELERVEGVHGPRTLVVILISEL